MFRTVSETSEPFWSANGLKQGDTMSVELFNIALDKAVRETETTRQIFSIDDPRLLIAFDIAKFNIQVKEHIVKLEQETN